MPVAYVVHPRSVVKRWFDACVRRLTSGAALKSFPAPMPSVTPSPPPPVAPAPATASALFPGTAAHAAAYACDPPFDLRTPQLRADALSFLREHEFWGEPDAVSAPVLARSVLRRLSLFGALRDDLVRDSIFCMRLRLDAAFLARLRHVEGAYRALCAVVALTARVCFDAPSEAVDRELTALYKVLREQFDKHGAHISRSFSIELYTLEALVALRDVSVKRGLPVDNTLRELMINIAEHLRAFRCDDGALPLFNGTFVESPLYIERVLEGVPVRNDVSSPDDGGYVCLRGRRTRAVADFGRAPEASFAQQMHAGLFSFELSCGAQRVIVNCGGGLAQGDDWRKALRVGAAHSGLSLDGLDCVAFDEQGAVRTPPQLHRKMIKTARGPVVEGSHNGWVKSHGLLHRRRLVLHNDGTVLQGEDWLTRVTPTRETAKQPPRQGGTFAVRFHLHPDVEPELIKSGGAVLHLPDGKSWLMTPGARPLSIEESVYVEGARVRACKQLVLAGNINRDETKIRWVLQGMKQTKVEEHVDVGVVQQDLSLA